MESKPVQLDGLVEDIKRQATVLAQEQEVQVVMGTVEPVSVAGDEFRLRELLLNLVDNAVKYSFKGGIVELNLVTDGQTARLSVADSGIGIEPDDQAHIFQRFYRADQARAHAKKGTGLGLSICKWIVEAHRGTIQLNSQPGKGTTVTVVLPLLSASPSH